MWCRRHRQSKQKISKLQGLPGESRCRRNTPAHSTSSFCLAWSALVWSAIFKTVPKAPKCTPPPIMSIFQVPNRNPPRPLDTDITKGGVVPSLGPSSMRWMYQPTSSYSHQMSDQAKCRMTLKAGVLPCGEWVHCRPVASPGGACGATISLILHVGGACGAAIRYPPISYFPVAAHAVPHYANFLGPVGAQ
eukprot:gene25443-biopygen6006